MQKTFRHCKITKKSHTTAKKAENSKVKSRKLGVKILKYDKRPKISDYFRNFSEFNIYFVRKSGGESQIIYIILQRPKQTVSNLTILPKNSRKNSIQISKK